MRCLQSQEAGPSLVLLPAGEDVNWGVSLGSEFVGLG